MAQANFMQRVGKSSCIRCEFETDETMSFADQDAALMAHLKVAHPRWMLEPLTPEQTARLAERQLTPDQRRIAELQSQLDALTWTEITPENLPKIGDELFAHHVFRVAQWDTVSSVTNIHATWRVDDFLNCGWTHFRPLNPPPPSGAKGETKP